MTDLLIKQLSASNPNVIITAFIILCFLCWYLFKNRTILTDFFNNLYNRKKEKENLLKTIQDNQAQIKLIMENRIQDRQQLTASIAAISEKIDEMQRNTDMRFSESERKNNKHIRAELKDKISRSYRYYHCLGKINDMELEALEDLIEEYESVQGENSFVHSVVQKEMYTWERTDKI